MTDNDETATDAPIVEEVRRVGLAWPVWVAGVIGLIAAMLAVFGR